MAASRHATESGRDVLELLSWALVALMAVQAAAGLLVPGLYRDPEAWMRAAWFGNDLVTLCVAVPVLAGAIMTARRGSRRGELVWYGVLGYAVYNYAFYLFGARMNAHFPEYVLLFVAALLALILALGRLDVRKVASEFGAGAPVRWVAGYMILTGVGLGGAWLAQWALFVFAGVEPAIGEEPFALIAAIDLTFIVPWSLLGGALLWRRRPWGFVLGVVVTLGGALYTLVLTAASLVGAARGIGGAGGQAPIWAAWTAAGLGALALLLSHLRSR